MKSVLPNLTINGNLNNRGDNVDNYNELKNITDTFDEGQLENSGALKKFFHRLGRKLTFWYVGAFGERQNKFNRETAESITDLAQKQYVDMLLLENNIKELRRKLDEKDVLLSEYIRRVNPECRNSFFPDKRGEISRELSADLTGRLLLESNPDLDAWGEKYRETIMKTLSEKKTSCRTIAVICRNFLQSKGIEAVRCEAVDLYKLLKRVSRYDIKFVSIEPSLTETKIKGELMLIPEKGAGNVIKAINPALCIFCETTAGIILSDGCSMLKQRAILKLSGQNPLNNISSNTVKELIHLNDMGLHHYMVESEKAAEIMVKAGFPEPDVSYPVTSLSKIGIRKRKFDTENFTVGFASSPMLEKQFDDRGVGILCELVKLTENIKYKILWRYPEIPIPVELAENPMCEVIEGGYDMQKFYSETDCVIIPYKTVDNNHACSLSAIEAMQNGVPVLATDVSGVAEVVNKCGMGETVSADAESLRDGLIRITENYPNYLTPLTKQRLDMVTDNTIIIEMIEKQAEKHGKPKPATLSEWDSKLKAKGKYLVIGHEEMKKYYQQKDIADSYTKDRFTTPALKYFDYIERQNIGIILDSRFKDKKPSILDVACGDGRITAECIKHGNCVSADSSRAMLDIVEERFRNEENKPATFLYDAIEDSYSGNYDAITCFRYIRHFSYAERCIIYRNFREMLKDSGMLVFDVPNIDFELGLKGVSGWGNYNIYDVFHSIEAITEELRRNGFKVEYVIPTGQGLMTQLPESLKKMPMTWTVGAIKQA